MWKVRAISKQVPVITLYVARSLDGQSKLDADDRKVSSKTVYDEKVVVLNRYLILILRTRGIIFALLVDGSRGNLEIRPSPLQTRLNNRNSMVVYQGPHTSQVVRSCGPLEFLGKQTNAYFPLRLDGCEVCSGFSQLSS